MPPILEIERHWECFDCDVTDVTYTPGFISRLHHCRGHAMLEVPMVEAGTKGRLIVHELEDYIGDKLVQCDAEGRPVTHTHVVRDDGMDATVYPAAAAVNAQRE